MLLIISKIEKKNKIKFLLALLFALLNCMLYAQDVQEQTRRLESLYEQKIQLLEEQLFAAIFFCNTMGVVTLLSLFFIIYDDQISRFMRLASAKATAIFCAIKTTFYLKKNK